MNLKRCWAPLSGRSCYASPSEWGFRSRATHPISFSIPEPWAGGGLWTVFWLCSKGRFRRSQVLFQNLKLSDREIKAELGLLVLLLFISGPYITNVFEPICKCECMGILWNSVLGVMSGMNWGFSIKSLEGEVLINVQKQLQLFKIHFSLNLNSSEEHVYVCFFFSPCIFLSVLFTNSSLQQLTYSLPGRMMDDQFLMPLLGTATAQPNVLRYLTIAFQNRNWCLLLCTVPTPWTVPDFICKWHWTVSRTHRQQRASLHLLPSLLSGLGPYSRALQLKDWLLTSGRLLAAYVHPPTRQQSWGTKLTALWCCSGLGLWPEMEWDGVCQRKTGRSVLGADTAMNFASILCILKSGG